MLADPTFVQKLWNKGVDIAASVVASTITAAIIAGIATLTWRYKRKRDLELEDAKQRQHDRVALELEHEKRKRDYRERIKRLAKERDDFVAALESSANPVRIQELWDDYLRWLYSNKLQSLLGNQVILNECSEERQLYAQIGGGIEGPRDQAVKWIKRTELPSPVLPD